MVLLEPTSKMEVHQAFMSMNSYKALGPNGFQPIFLNIYWEITGDDVWQFVARVFQSGTFDTRVVEALMVLIPKEDSPTTFKHSWPINLLNVVYRLMLKVLVSILRLFLNDIISPHKSSFISG